MVDGVTSSSAATASSSSGSSNGTTKKEVSSDFETFLRMLTVQLKNQDPLNPVESSDYAVQLATFSGVEQQVQTNALLKTLTTNLGGGGLSQYGTWVGMEAAAPVAAKFDGTTPLTIMPEFDDDAETAKLVVRDANGNIVQSQPMDLTADMVSWTGNGKLGAGTYSFIVDSYAADGTQLSEAAAKVYAPITEIRTDAGAISVVFESGDVVSSNDVGGLRDPA